MHGSIVWILRNRPQCVELILPAGYDLFELSLQENWTGIPKYELII